MTPCWQPPIILADRFTPLGQTYAYWSTHWTGCETCSQAEWYDPPLHELPLCPEGRRLFRAWVRAAAVKQVRDDQRRLLN